MFQILFLVGMFALFYFIAIRPQRKRQKEHAAMVAALMVAPIVGAAWHFGPHLLARALNAFVATALLVGVASSVALAFAAFEARSELQDAEDLAEENRRLRRENEHLRRQRDILKKAAAILGEDPHAGMR